MKHFFRFVDSKEIPESFPYKAKAFFAFEEVDGVDICFFGVHVQVRVKLSRGAVQFCHTDLRSILLMRFSNSFLFFALYFSVANVLCVKMTEYVAKSALGRFILFRRCDWV